MYKKRVKDWHFEKNYKIEDKEAIARVLEACAKNGRSAPGISVRGRPAKLYRIQRFYRREKKPGFATTFPGYLPKKMTVNLHQVACSGPTKDMERCVPLPDHGSALPAPSHDTWYASAVERPLSIPPDTGCVEPVLAYTKVFCEWSTTLSSNLSDPTTDEHLGPARRLHPFSTAYDSSTNHPHLFWDKMYFGVNMLERNHPQVAFDSLQQGCDMVKDFLSRGPEHVFQGVFIGLGSYRWDQFQSVQDVLLSFLARMSTILLGASHLVTLLLQNLQTGDVIKRSAEFALRIMLDSFQKRLGSVHPDVLRLKRALCVVLRRQHEYRTSEAILVSAIRESEQLRGYNDGETRQCLQRLSNLYTEQARYGSAMKLTEDAIQRGEAACGDELPDQTTIHAMHSGAIIAEQMEDYGKSEYWYMRLESVLRGKGVGDDNSLRGISWLRRRSITPDSSDLIQAFLRFHRHIPREGNLHTADGKEEHHIFQELESSSPTAPKRSN